jgi:hypothetical protein
MDLIAGKNLVFNDFSYNEDQDNTSITSRRTIDGVKNRIDEKGNVLNAVKQEMYLYFRENLKRWCTCLGCLTRFYQPTRGEEEVLSTKLSDWNKKYLVHRKSRLTFVFLFMLMATLTTLINNILVLPTTHATPVDDDNTQAVIRSYAQYYTTRVNLGFDSVRTFTCLIILLARITWHNYKISTRLIMFAYGFQIFFPMIIYFVPYRNLFLDGNNSLSIGVQGAIFLYILYLSKNFVYLIALLPQNMISNANSLSYTYPNTPEFKIAAVTVNIIYVPLVVIWFNFSGFIWS